MCANLHFPTHNFHKAYFIRVFALPFYALCWVAKVNKGSYLALCLPNSLPLMGPTPESAASTPVNKPPGMSERPDSPICPPLPG